VAAELQQREALNYPPYGQLILLRLSATNPVAVQTGADRVAQFLTQHHPNCELLGPAPATILRVARRYRWQILLKVPSDREAALPELDHLRSCCGSAVSLTIDIDPMNLM
jgi:primosomal protein N' (replication factor Y) (superfamily II helicase)